MTEDELKKLRNFIDCAKVIDCKQATMEVSQVDEMLLYIGRLEDSLARERKAYAEHAVKTREAERLIELKDMLLANWEEKYHQLKSTQGMTPEQWMQLHDLGERLQKLEKEAAELKSGGLPFRATHKSCLERKVQILARQVRIKDYAPRYVVFRRESGEIQVMIEDEFDNAYPPI